MIVEKKDFSRITENFKAERAKRYRACLTGINYTTSQTNLRKHFDFLQSMTVIQAQGV